MHDVANSAHCTKVELEDEICCCCCIELLFEQSDADCMFQVVQTFYQGRRADFILRIFGNVEDGHFLEIEACTKSEAILDMEPEDLLGIHNAFQKISEKYDLAAKTSKCEIKPYYRH